MFAISDCNEVWSGDKDEDATGLSLGDVVVVVDFFLGLPTGLCSLFFLSKFFGNRLNRNLRRPIVYYLCKMEQLKVIHSTLQLPNHAVIECSSVYLRHQPRKNPTCTVHSTLLDRIPSCIDSVKNSSLPFNGTPIVPTVIHLPSFWFCIL